jgi:carboxymethylenebutenolidase
MFRRSDPASIRLVTALTVLLATALAWPLSAQHRTETTPPAMVHLPTADGGVDAYVAWPSGTAHAPAILVVHEWWGLGDQIKDVARRLAREGYVAIVPDLYHGKVATTPEMAHELVRGLEDTRVFSELDTAAAWARAQPRVEGMRVGILGFCVGGGITLRYALHQPDLGAAVMFYGPPETDPGKLATLKAPLQGHFGALDQGIPPDRVEAMRAAMRKAGKTADLYVYPGAGHAFMHDGLPSYHADAAKTAWARTLAFLQRYLKG